MALIVMNQTTVKENLKSAFVTGGFQAENGAAEIALGNADMIAYGQPYIANPDLVARFKAGADLNTPDLDTFYGGDAKGYTDYPFLK